jgi:hypothetical protein
MKTDICTFMIISRWILLRMRNLSYKICREIQHTVYPFTDEAQTALFKYPVRTALQTLFFSVTKTNQFMLYVP